MKFFHETEITAFQYIYSRRQTISKKASANKRRLQDALILLAEDAFHPKLKTHKLKGDLLGSWSCSAGYDL